MPDDKIFVDVPADFVMLEITRMAYRAYGDVVEWKNYRGDPMPQFDELPQRTRDAWLASTLATIDAHERASTITEPGPS